MLKAVRTRGNEHDEPGRPRRLPRLFHRLAPVSADYHAGRIAVRINGRSPRCFWSSSPRTFVDLIRPGTGMMIVFVLIATKFLLQALAASGVRHVGAVSLPTITPAPMAIAVAGVMAFTLTWRIVKLARRAGTTPA